MEIKEGLLTATVGGPFSLEEAKNTFTEVLDMVCRHQIEKVLLEGSSITGDVEAMERYFYAVFAADSVLGAVVRKLDKPPRFAYVLQLPVLDPNRYGEEVARERGMIVKVFSDKEDALKWLHAERAFGRSK